MSARNLGQAVQRIRLTITIVLLLGTASPLSAATALQRVDLGFTFIGKPIIHDDMIVGKTNHHHVVKRNLYGQDLWDLPRKNDPATDLDIKFKRLFIVSAKGHLASHDLEHGYRFWQQDEPKVKAILAVYPFVIYKGFDQTIGTLDFFSGQKLGTRKMAVKDLYFLSPIQKIIVMAGNKIIFIDPLYEKEDAHVTLPTNSTQVESTWQQYIILSRFPEIFIVDGKQKKVQRAVVDLPKQYRIRGKYLYAVDDDAKKWRKYDLITGDQIWEAAMLNGKDRHIYWGQNSLMLRSKNNQARLFSYETGKSHWKSIACPALPKADILNFYIRKDNYFLITSKAVYWADLDRKAEPNLPKNDKGVRQMSPMLY